MTMVHGGALVESTVTSCSDMSIPSQWLFGDGKCPADTLRALRG